MLKLLNIFSRFRELRLRWAVARYRDNPGPDDAVIIARLLVRQGRGDEALRAIRQARRNFPGSAAVASTYTFVRQNQARGALRLALKHLSRKPRLEHFLRVSDLYRALGQPDKALSHLEKAAEQFSDHWAVHLARGRLAFSRFRKTGDPEYGELCLKHLRRAHALNPDNYQTLLFLGIICTHLNLLGEATRAIETILKAIPTDPKALELKEHLDRALTERPEALAATATASPETETSITTSNLEPETREALDRLKSLPGVTGLFLLDEDGGVASATTRDNKTFDFTSSPETIKAMVAECRFQASQLGIGELNSCLLAGDSWHVYVRPLATKSLILFRDIDATPESLDTELASVLEGVPLT